MNIKEKFRAFLPGIFLLGFGMGTGSVTSMAKAGADYGMALLWTILLSCLVTYYMIVIYGKFTLVTGKTALHAFRKHIHPSVGIFFIVALTAVIGAAIMGVMGIITDVCYVWSKSFIPGGIDAIWFAVFFIAIVYLLFWSGSTDLFQKALAIIVAVMTLAFIVNFFLLMPPISEIGRGLVPRIPETLTGAKSAPLLIIASMVGTTVFSGLFIIRTTLVQEAGWTLDDLKQQQKDAALSATMMFIIALTIMAAAAGTLHKQGLNLTEASQMVVLLEPLAGAFAVAIFVIGLVSAGLSSQFPNVLLLPWLLLDYTQEERDLKKPKFRIMVLIMSLLGLVVPIFKARPVFAMIASQAFGSLILPATVLCILYIGNKKSVMGEHTHPLKDNIILVLILIFSLYMSVAGIRGLIGSITS